MFNTELGLYVHVPFCASTCDFCAFYQEAPHREDLERYLAGIERELASYELAGRPVSTVFFGGGTPGLLAAKDLERLCRAVRQFAGDHVQEWTIEFAPSTVKADKLAIIRELGVNRISMGVQSFQPQMLEEMGRRHSPKQVYEAIERVRESGIGSMNLDLIISSPSQTEELLRADLEEIRSIDPEHVSTYCLTFEDDTKLYARMLRGEVRPKSEDEDALLYTLAWEGLEAMGYQQYEISNLAKPGHACQHNINTWYMQEWIGVGPSASSQYAEHRYTNPHNLQEWLAGLEPNNAMPFTERQTVDSEMLALDSLIFGLRMNAGISIPHWQRRFPDSSWYAFQPCIDSLIEENLCRSSPEQQLTLTASGRLLADRIAIELMEAAEDMGTKKPLTAR